MSQTVPDDEEDEAAAENRSIPSTDGPTFYSEPRHPRPKHFVANHRAAIDQRRSGETTMILLMPWRASVDHPKAYSIVRRHMISLNKYYKLDNVPNAHCKVRSFSQVVSSSVTSKLRHVRSNFVPRRNPLLAIAVSSQAVTRHSAAHPLSTAHKHAAPIVPSNPPRPSDTSCAL